MMDDIWRYKGQKDPPRCEGSSRVAVVYYVGTPENEDVFWLHLFEISFYGTLKMFCSHFGAAEVSSALQLLAQIILVSPSNYYTHVNQNSKNLLRKSLRNYVLNWTSCTWRFSICKPNKRVIEGLFTPKKFAPTFARTPNFCHTDSRVICPIPVHYRYY